MIRKLKIASECLEHKCEYPATACEISNNARGLPRFVDVYVLTKEELRSFAWELARYTQLCGLDKETFEEALEEAKRL